MNLFSKKTAFGLPVILLAAISLLSSCKEYKPFIACTIDGTPIRIETSVAATYVGNISTVAGDGGDTDVNVRFSAMSPGNYTCGTSGNGTIEIFMNSTTYTTNATNGSGTIQVITAGNNLIEGYFSGQLYSGSDHIVVTNGSFSGRAY